LPELHQGAMQWRHLAVATHERRFERGRHIRDRMPLVSQRCDRDIQLDAPGPQRHDMEIPERRDSPERTLGTAR
jgi:hypothetical protein